MPAASILAQLENPGLTLAFCDETDLTRAATSTMVADLHLHAALVIASEKYALAAEAIRQRCVLLGVPEFHATEIVNPGSKSPWRAIDYKERLEALQLACGLIVEHTSTVWYAYISKGQYQDLHAANPTTPSDYKSAVKANLLEHVADRLIGASNPVMVKDKEKPSAGPTMKSLPNASHIAGGGVVCADSSAAPGLQLVDVAAYSIGRFIRRRDAIIARQITPVDELFMETIGELGGRLKSLIHEAK